MIGTLYRREFLAYFATPLAWIFIVIFVILSGVFTFYMGSFYDRGQADLDPFFQYVPWLYLFLIPAIAMRVWAEERKTGTLELLLTLPVTLWQVSLAKFLAAWTAVAVALALTFPLWLTVNYLGDPDNGAILAAYLGSLLMAGGYLAIGTCISAATRNQVIAFVVAVMACFVFTLAGFTLLMSVLRGWLPDPLIEAVASLGFLTHFQAISHGVVTAPDLVFFLAMIAVWLYASTVVIDLKKAN